MEEDKKPAVVATKRQSKDKQNWLLYQLYVRKDFGKCMEMIEAINYQYGGQHEFANYLKALILRNSGELVASLDLLKDLHGYNEANYDVLKQIARSMFLCGKYKASVEVANQALAINPNDWQLIFTQGQCYLNTEEYDKALSSFSKANKLSKHESTFSELGRLYTIMREPEKAAKVYEEALEHSNENSDILVILGIISLTQGNELKAFQYLGRALSIDNKDSRGILAACSIMQDKQDYDAALLKYRIMAQQNPNSHQLWNNIGMCFYGKQLYIASIACLKKALYLSPFQWITCLNLGLVYMTTQQYATAYFFLSVSINLRSDYALTYMNLGQCLNKLEDFPNACAAFRKAIEIEKDYLIYLNFAIILAQRGQTYFGEAKENALIFEEKFNQLLEDSRVDRNEILEQRATLSKLLSLNLPVIPNKK